MHYPIQFSRELFGIGDVNDGIEDDDSVDDADAAYFYDYNGDDDIMIMMMLI